MKVLRHSGRCSRTKPGFTVVVFVLGLLFFMAALLMANSLALNRLDREVRAVEKRQTQRLNPGTNAIPPRPTPNSPPAQ